MTFDNFIEIGKLRSNMQNYKQKKQNAIDVCCQCFEDYKNPYLALSGGKDSVAMAFLVNEAANKCGKAFRLWSHISDASFPGTLETCKETAQRINKPLDIYSCPQSAYDYLNSPQKRAFGKSGVFFDSVKNYAIEKDLAFVGVRAYESKRRMKAAKSHGQIFSSKAMGDITVCNPLLWFRLEDVAAVLYEYNAPVHPIYKKFAIGQGQNALHEDMFIRLGYITSRDLLNKGTAVFIRYNYPDIFAKLVVAYPEIRNWV